jgi:hypothetical protein
MTGLTGGFGHCVGMCGPFIGSFTLAGPPDRTSLRLGAQALYHAGRLMSYGFIGAMMGLAGSFVNVAGRMAGVQNGVMVLAGCLMVLMGLAIAGAGGAAWLERHNRPVLKAAGAVLEGATSGRFLPLGLLMGFLPCGLSYTMFIAAAGSGGPLTGLATMLAFGAGTLPALLLFGAAAGYLGSRLRGLVQRLGGVSVMVMGIYFLVKGVRLYAQM